MTRAVGDIFAGARAAPPLRRCPSCGAERATARAECPVCGKRYDRRAAWLSDRARWVLGALSVLLLAGAAAFLVPGILDAKAERERAEAAARAQRVEAERRRLRIEQRPRRGRAGRPADPGASAAAADRLAARRGLVGALEGAILADARERIARGELEGPVSEVRCGPLVRTPGAVGDEEDPAKRLGRYDCVAVQREVIEDGRSVGALGHPFVGTVDFRAARLVWCKDNKAPSERGEALAKVTLDAACVGAEGSARVGDGYVAPED